MLGDIAVKPVDYKGGEPSNHIQLGVSSHHRYGLFIAGRRAFLPVFV